MSCDPAEKTEEWLKYATKQICIVDAVTENKNLCEPVNPNYLKPVCHRYFQTVVRCKVQLIKCCWQLNKNLAVKHHPQRRSY